MGCPLVRLDPEPELGHALGNYRPVLPLEGRARRAEVVLLAQQFPVRLPAVNRDGQLDLLGAGDLMLLDFQDDLADCLRGVEGQGQRLLTELPGHPAAPARSPLVVEGVVHGMLGSLGGHQHGGHGGNVDLSRHGVRG